MNTNQMLNHPVSLLPWFGGTALTLIGLLAGAGCTGPWKRLPGDRDLQVSAEGSLKYGPVNGFVQTPNGGNPGTTSNNRPTFNELDIEDALIPDVSLGLGWRGHELYGGASFVRLDGDSTLNTSLISHGVTFPAGTAVTSDVQLDWYRFGYEYRFAFANEEGTSFALSPGAGFAVLNFDYRLKGTGGLSANRSYIVGTPQIGLGAEWIPAGRFSVEGGVFSSLPDVSNLFILSAQVTGQYQLWGTTRHGGGLFLGVGYDRIVYEDNQPVPNHIKADMVPLLRFGLRAHF